MRYTILAMRFAILSLSMLLVVQLCCRIEPAPLAPTVEDLRAPILVADHGVFPESSKAAVQLWNSQVGCEVVRWTDGQGQFTFYTDESNETKSCPDCNPDTIGLALCEGGTCRLVIDRSRVNDYCKQIQIAAHEIGHGLGLEHAEVGIMRSPIYKCADNWIAPAMFIYRIDDASREAVKRRYCK